MCVCVNVAAKAAELPPAKPDIKPLMSIETVPPAAAAAAVAEQRTEVLVKQEVGVVQPPETIAVALSVAEPPEPVPPSQYSAVTVPSSPSTPVAPPAAPSDIPFPGAPPPPPPPFSGLPPFFPGMPPHLANIPLPGYPPPPPPQQQGGFQPPPPPPPPLGFGFPPGFGSGPSGFGGLDPPVGTGSPQQALYSGSGQVPPAPQGGPPAMQNVPPFPAGGPPLRPVGIAGPGFQQGGSMPPQNVQPGFGRPPSSMNAGAPQFGPYGPHPPQPPGMPPGHVRPLLPELAGRPSSERASYDPERPDDDDDEDARYDQFDREIRREPEPLRYGQDYNQEPYRYEPGGEADYYDDDRRRDRQGNGMSSRQYPDRGRRRSPSPPRRGRESSRRRSRSRDRRRSRSRSRDRRRSRSRSGSPPGSTGYRARRSRSPDRRDRHRSPSPDTWKPSFGRANVPGPGTYNTAPVYLMH